MGVDVQWMYFAMSVGLVLLVRLLPAWRWPTFTSDAGFHLLLRREIRANGFRMPRKLEPCPFDERVEYPWFYHQLIAFLPEAWLRRLPALPSAIIDGLHALLAGWGAHGLVSALGHPEAAARAGLLSILFLGMNPALLAHGMGPRAYEVTPRPLGELLFSATMLSAIWAAASGNWVGWIVAAVAGGLLLLSSKFAAQVLVFSLPLLALVPGFHPAVGVLPGAFLAAMVLSGGRYGHVLRGQWIHLRYYRRNLQYTCTMVSELNRWRDVRAAWDALRRTGLLSKIFFRAVARLYATNTYLLLLLRGPVFLFPLALVLSPAHRGALRMAEGPSLWLAGWACAWLLPFVLTSTRHLRFLGEAERYAEYAICPASILAAAGLALGPFPGFLAGGVLLYAACLAAILAQAWTVNSRLANRGARERRDLVEALRQLPPGSTLLGIPAMQVLAPVASLLPHRYADITTDASALIRMIDEQFVGYPWPKPDWEMWRAMGVDHVVTFSPDYLRSRRPGLPYDRIPLEVISEHPAFRIYAYPQDGISTPPKAKCGL